MTTTASSTRSSRRRSSNTDGNPEIDFARSEIDEGEYVRFMYHRPGCNALVELRARPEGPDGGRHVHRPAASAAGGGPPQTAFKLEITSTKRSTGTWLKTSVTARARSRRASTCPADAADGAYDGAIEVKQGTAETIIVPVDGQPSRRRRSRRPTASCRARRPSAAPASRRAQTNLLYNNGSVFGAHDWTWRAESGDWRFFFLDVPKAPPTGHAVPRQHDVGRRGAAHRPRHGHLRPVGEHVPVLRRHRVRSARRTSSTRSAPARTRTSPPACGSSTRPRAATRRS